MKINIKNNKGFTLIELLVVFAIISLMSSIVFGALNSARMKARDAKRASDMRNIRVALELYYAENGHYPDTSPGYFASIGTYNSGSPFVWPTLLTPYIKTMPDDPTNIAGQYGYYYSTNIKPTGNCNFIATSKNTDYILATRFENPAMSPCPGGIINDTNGGTGGWDNASINYLAGASQ